MMIDPQDTATTTHYWLPNATSPVDCLCVGTGRFLRAVLIPVLNAARLHPILIQTRGRTFLEYMQGKSMYPIDTVLPNGQVVTDDVSCFGAFSWGRPSDREAFYEWLTRQDLHNLRVIGIGVTEAGMASAETPVMKEVAHLFHFLSTHTFLTKISVINTDNVPDNGGVLERHMNTLANESTRAFLRDHVIFHNSMVDRITASRSDDALVARAEPLPAKALVVLDPERNLPFEGIPGGVILRTSPDQLQLDINLKLRIANGTHTAIAHLLALLKFPQTDALATADCAPLLLQYLDALFQHQILPACAATDEAIAVYRDWRSRLVHPHFGLSTFFITQNGPAKGGIRLGPTVQGLIRGDRCVTIAMAFAFAILLRWLTPQIIDNQGIAVRNKGIYRGWLQGGSRRLRQEMILPSSPDEGNGNIEYADGLRYNLCENWYEFRCSCIVLDDGRERNLADWLGVDGSEDIARIARAYLVAEQGGNLPVEGLDPLVNSIASLYRQMVDPDTDLLKMLGAMQTGAGEYQQGFSTPCLVRID